MPTLSQSYSLLLNPSLSSDNTIRISSAGVVGLTVQGASGQTANLQEWQSSAGAINASISAAGALTCGNISVAGGSSISSPVGTNLSIISGNGGSGTTSLTIQAGPSGTTASMSFISSGQTVMGLSNGIGALAGISLCLGYSFAFSSSSNIAAGDLFFNRRAAANLNLGGSDAAAPVAQTLSVQRVSTGTSNIAGANLR